MQNLFKKRRTRIGKDELEDPTAQPPKNCACPMGLEPTTFRILNPGIEIQGTPKPDSLPLRHEHNGLQYRPG